MIDTQNTITVTINDARAMGYCSHGLRQFFVQQGLNWPAFLQHGMDARELVDFDDDMVRAVVERARMRIKTGA